MSEGSALFFGYYFTDWDCGNDFLWVEKLFLLWLFVHKMEFHWFYYFSIYSFHVVFFCLEPWVVKRWFWNSFGYCCFLLSLGYDLSEGILMVFQRTFFNDRDVLEKGSLLEEVLEFGNLLKQWSNAVCKVEHIFSQAKSKNLYWLTFTKVQSRYLR